MSESKLQEAVSARIRALLSKTVENGATEHEAMAAASKARELMDRYRLTLTDVEIAAEPIEGIDVERDPANCWDGISAYCGVKCWAHWVGGAKKLRFFGLRADTEMAKYLSEMVSGAIRVECERYKRTDDYKASRGGRAATSAFRHGMAQRINARLHQMARATDKTAMTGSGTALVVVKGAAVAEAFAKLDMHLRSSTSRYSIRDGGAYGAGKAAGDRVNLSRPVNSAGTRRIG